MVKDRPAKPADRPAHERDDFSAWLDQLRITRLCDLLNDAFAKGHLDDTKLFDEFCSECGYKRVDDQLEAAA